MDMRTICFCYDEQHRENYRQHNRQDRQMYVFMLTFDAQCPPFLLTMQILFASVSY